MNTEKIYSRPSYGLKKMENKTIIISTIMIIIIAYITATRIIGAINPTIERESRAIAKSTAEKLCNEASKEIMNSTKYEDLCTISKDSNGNVSMINMNVININKTLNEIALKIQEGMNTRESDIVNISLGSLTGSKILSGRGPKIKVKIKMMGNVHTSIKSEIKEAGINQSVHKIYANIESEISLISPYKDTDETINSEVLLAESIIIGKIPETYYNLNGLKQEDATNMLN